MNRFTFVMERQCGLRSYLIFLIFQNYPSPNSPKESGSVPVMSITYLGLMFIFPINFHPGPSTLSVFRDFRFPHTKSPQCHLIWSGFKIRALRHNILSIIKFHYEILFIKLTRSQVINTSFFLIFPI